MKTASYLAAFIGILNLCAISFVGFRVYHLEKLAADTRVPFAASNRPGETPSRDPDQTDPMKDVQLRKADAVGKRVDELESTLSKSQETPEAKIEAFARGLAEMDEWAFAPEEEAQATKLLDDCVDRLRTKITTRVKELSTEACAAPDGNAAALKLAQINSILGIYPAPKTDPQRADLQQITSGILMVSRQVEDLRRLRYNAWAVSKIEVGLKDYHTGKSKFWNYNAITQSCITSLEEIDPSFLEPATMDLYSSLIKLTKDATYDGNWAWLAKALATPNKPRKTPLEF